MSSKFKKSFCIFIDTNNLGVYRGSGLYPEDFKLFCLNPIFIELLSFIKDNKINCKIYLPKIVLEELKQQQIESYNESVNNYIKLFHRFKNLISIKNDHFKKAEDYAKHLDDILKSFLDSYNEYIEVIDAEESFFSKILEKAIFKKSPFYKKTKNDAGIKDAVIFEIIKKVSKENYFSEYLFVTKDKDFLNDDNKTFDYILKKEFFKESGNDLNHFLDFGELKIYLNNILDLKKLFSEIESSYDDEVRKKIHRKTSYSDLLNKTTKVYYVGKYQIKKLINIQEIKGKEDEFYLDVEAEVLGLIYGFENESGSQEVEIRVRIKYKNEKIEVLEIVN